MLSRRTKPIARPASWLLMLALLVVVGCGGSGSSGFDGEPAGSEPDAVREAVEQGSCVEFDDMTYCGSGAPFAVNTDATVEIDEPLTPLGCSELPDETACVASLGFTAEGFAPRTTFLVASSDSFAGLWRTSDVQPPPSSGGASEGRDAQVELPTPGGTSPTTPLIVAVLVYLDGPAAEPPSEAPELADFGASVAYVSHELLVRND